ncbi:unnamed protein product [Cochlearia groenlandica]
MAPGRKRGASKAKDKGQLILGDLVFAKVKGFPAWPAKISRPEEWGRAPDPKKYFVQFFGTQEIAFVSPPDIQAFTSEAKNKLLSRCQGKTVKYFAQAVKEICTAFEELQNDKSNVLGNEDSLKAAEPGLAKAEVVDATDRIVTEIGKRDSSPIIDSKITTTSSASGSLEHGSYDPKKEEEDFDKRPDSDGCSEHFGNGQKNLANGEVIKKVPCGADRKDEDSVHRDERNNSNVPNGRAARSDSQKSEGPVTEKSCSKASERKRESSLAFKGRISGKKRSLESESGKPAPRVVERSHAAKRPRCEGASDKEKCEIGAFSDSPGPVSDVKREIVLGLSARGGNLQYEKVVAYTKCPRKTVEHATSPPFSEPPERFVKVQLEKKEHTSSVHDKSRKGHVEQKDRSSSVSNVKVPAAQSLKRRRAVCIYDEDDDDEDPKTPLHGSQDVAPKATSVLTDVPRSANVCQDTSTKAKMSAGPTKSTGLRKVPLLKHRQDASHVLSDNLENSTNRLPIVKPINELPPKDVKQILRSPKMSPPLVSPNKHSAGHNKTAKSSVNVSGAVMAKKPQIDSYEETVAESDKGSSFQSQPANQRHKPASVEDRPTVVSKDVLHLNDAGVSRDTSEDSSAGILDPNRENWSAPFMSAKTPDSAASMKDLIAAAQAKRKVAHSQNSTFGKLKPSISDTQMVSHSPIMVHSASASTANAMPLSVERHQKDSSPSNHGPDDDEDRRHSSRNKSVGGSLSGGTEAAVSRDAFEGMIETLSRTKESIGRATRLAIDCAKYGIATEVVELLIRKLESAPHLHRKVDLFFLVDSITQCSHNQKGIAGVSYVPTVQAALPRLLGAAAPPGTDARDNRRKCLKVLKLWLDRKIFPESFLRRYIDDIGSTGDNATVGFSLRRPSRSERAVDDPIREMEGMLVDEYGSNATIQLPGLFSTNSFEDDEEDDDSPTTQKAKNTSAGEPLNALEDLAKFDTSSGRCDLVLVGVDRGLEMKDVNGQRKDIATSFFCENETKEQSLEVRDPVSEESTEEPPFPESSPPLPHESPPSPPPLPRSPPPLSPPLPPSSPPPLLPLSTAQFPPLPPPPPLSRPPSPPPPPPAQYIASPSLATQPSISSHPQLPLQLGFPHPTYGYSHQTYPGSMQQDCSSIFMVSLLFLLFYIPFLPLLTLCLISGQHVQGDQIGSRQLEFGNSDVLFNSETSSRNQRFQPSTPLSQIPRARKLPSAPSSHFPYPVQSQSQHSYTHPYAFPPQRDDGQRYRNEEPWQMSSSRHNAENHSGAWIHGRNSHPGLPRVGDNFFRPPSVTMSYPPSTGSNLQAVPAISGHATSQMLPSRPGMPTANRWRQG